MVLPTPIIQRISVLVDIQAQGLGNPSFDLDKAIR